MITFGRKGKYLAEGSFMQEIETARLRLRRFTADDLDAVRRIYSDTEVLRYMWDGQARTEEQIRDALAFLMGGWEKRGIGMWAMVHKGHGEVIGRCGFTFLPGTTEAEIGYILARPYWGAGYATEAARACVRYGFEDRALPRIVAVTRPDNVASRRVLQKLGMAYEGLAQHYGAEQACYAIERDAYRERAAGAS